MYNMCVYIYIYIYIYTYIHTDIYIRYIYIYSLTAALRFFKGRVRRTTESCDGNWVYTQFAIQDSRLFGPNPWKILAPPSNYQSNKGFSATQPSEQILDSEFLLCELGVVVLRLPDIPATSPRDSATQGHQSGPSLVSLCPCLSFRHFESYLETRCCHLEMPCHVCVYIYIYIYVYVYTYCIYTK